MNKHLMMVLLAAAMAVGCSPKTQPPTEVDNPQPLQNKSFARQWSTDVRGTGAGKITAIYLSDAFVFAYSDGGTSTVMDRASGRLLHADQPRDAAEHFHPPVVLKDRIVYPTSTYLEVYDFQGRYIPHATKTSDELDKPFSQSLNFPIRSNAVGSGKLLFFGADLAGGGRAIELDMTRPYVPAVWTLMEPGSGVPAAPALVKDVVYVAAENGKVAAVATDNREPLWTLSRGVFGTYGGVVADLAADETGVYIASTDTKLYCLARSSGKVKWQYFAGTELKDAPVLTKDMVYQYVPGTGLVALEKNQISTSQNPAYNRNPRWTAASATQFLSEDANYTYVRNNRNQVLALDKKTGQVKFTSARSDLAVFGVNTKGDGLIYLATSSGRVMAVRPVLEPGQIGEFVLAPVPESCVALVR